MDGDLRLRRLSEVTRAEFIYSVTLYRPDVVARVRSPKVPLELLDIPSPTEVAAALSELESPVYRTLLLCAYGAGLRVSEAANLCSGDIDSKRMVPIVRNGKGGRDRYAMLSLPPAPPTSAMAASRSADSA